MHYAELLKKRQPSLCLITVKIELFIFLSLTTTFDKETNYINVE